MAERPSARDDDEISLTSTISEEYNADQEFEVDRVLAERTESGKKLYLLLWEGYPEEKSTWEPAEHINDIVLEIWRKRKKQERRDPSQRFDVARFESKLQALRTAKDKRHRLRKMKRRRLKIPVSSSESDLESVELEDIAQTQVSKHGAKMVKISTTNNTIQILAQDATPGPENPKNHRDSTTSQTTSVGQPRDDIDQTNISRTTLAASIDQGHEQGAVDVNQQQQKEQASNTEPQQGHLRSSSPDVPPSKNPRLSRPSVSSSSSDEASEPAGQHTKATVKRPSTGLELTPKTSHLQAVPTDVRSRENESTRGDSTLRGGRGATRGGSMLAQKNVFAMGKVSTSATKRRTLVDSAANSAQAPKKFSNKRLEYRAHVQGREKADAAPDISALPGGLFNPSNASVEPIRPANFRKQSLNMNEASRSEELFVSPEDGGDRMELDAPVAQAQKPNYQPQIFVKSTCYFWDRLQRNPNAVPCQLGAACNYLHSYREGASIAPPPTSSSAAPYEGISTCFFWDRKQSDNSQSGCSRGSECTYLHEHRSGVPIAPPPVGYIPRESLGGSTAKVTDAGNRHVMDADSGASISDSPYTCFYWDRYQNNTSYSRCNKGHRCAFLHEYKPGVPVAQGPGPYGSSEGPTKSLSFSSHNDTLWLTPWAEDDTNNYTSVPPAISTTTGAEPTRTPATVGNSQPLPQPTLLTPQSQLAVLSPQHEKFSTISAKPEENNRPEWDSNKPFNAICYLWCRDICEDTAEGCQFYHSNDKRLPLAPHPDFVQTHMSNQRVPHSSESSAAPRKERPDSPVSRRRKRPEWDPARLTNAVCYFFWRGGDCFRGGSCKYEHTYDEKLPIAPEPSSALKSIPCKDWVANGICNFPNCRFLHEPKKISSLRVERDMLLSPEINKGTEARRKSVKFAEEPEFDQGSSRDIHPSPNVRDRKGSMVSEDKRPLCHFNASKSCHFGSTCSFRHVDSSPIEKETKVSYGISTDRVDALLRDFSSGPLSRPDSEKNNYSNRSRTSLDGVDSKMSAPSLQKDESSIDTSRPVSQPETKTSLDRTKINISDYKRMKDLKERQSKGKEVVFGSTGNQPLVLKFGGIDSLQPENIRDAFMKTPRVVFTKICLAKDFQSQQSFLRRRELLSGNLASFDPENGETNKALSIAANELVLRSAGLLSILPGQTTDDAISILIFPTNKEEWNFMQSSPNVSSDACLQYFIFSWDFSVAQLLDNEDPAVSITKPYTENVFERFTEFEISSLLPYSSKDVERHNFFLFFTESAKKSEDNIVTWIKALEPKSKFYSIRHDGAWRLFLKEVNAGVVLVHESAAIGLSVTPYLLGTVNDPKKAWAFWFISDSGIPHPLYPSRFSLDRPVGKITATKLFPYGCAFLVTPSFLVAEPQRAYELFKWFLVLPKAKYISAAPRTWKLVACSKLSDYLLDVANSKIEEKEAFEVANQHEPAKEAIMKSKALNYDTCHTRLKLFSILQKLDKDGLLDPISHQVECGEVPDDSEDLESPFVYAPRRIDPDDEPALVKWFAGWAVQRLDRFKKFVVIGTSVDSAARASRIKEVKVTPPSKPDFKPFSFLKPSSKKSPASVATTQSIATTPAQKAAAVAARLSASAPGKPLPAVPPTAPAEDEDVVMADAIDEKAQEVAYAVAKFIDMTESNAVQAKYFLSAAQYDVAKAVQLFKVHDFSIPVDELTSGRSQSPSSGKPENSDQPSTSVTPNPNDTGNDMKPKEDGDENQDVEMRDVEGPVEATEKRDIKYEPTTEWYGKFNEERGYRWEHIYVEAYPKAFNFLGMTK